MSTIAPTQAVLKIVYRVKGDWRANTMVVDDRIFYSRRRFLLTAASLAGSAVLVACGGNNAAPTSGANTNCGPLKQLIAKDNDQIKLLQQQKANTTNQAKIAQINSEIAGLRQKIANLQQQGKQLGCP
jgi:alpha-D-ribose 1-methylphosphonate 5-phosphate C-P lyase